MATEGDKHPPLANEYRSRLPKAAVLAVLLIVAGEAVFLAKTEPLTGLPYLQPTADDAILTAKQKLIPKAAGRVVLVGDSSCTMGLKPAVLEAETGVPAVNLGTISTMTLAGFADLIDRACALEPRPRAVVFAALPRSFEVTEQQAHDFQLVGRYLTANSRGSPLYSSTIRERWEWLVRKHRVNVFPAEFGGSYRKYEADLLAADGWYPERGRYVLRPGEARDEFRPSEWAERGLMRLAEVCREHDVPLLVWWSPAPADSISEQYAAGVETFTARVRASLPGVPFPRPTVPRWEPARFGSVTHVTPTAAEANTRELAAALRGWLRN